MDYKSSLYRYDSLFKYYGDRGRAWVSLTASERRVLCDMRPKGFGVILSPSFCSSFLRDGYLKVPADDLAVMKRRYIELCWFYTDLNSVNIPGVEKRGFKGFHIDHIVPISYGFKCGILPSVIGSLENLRMLHHSENCLKGSRLTCDSYYLLSDWGV